MSLVDYGPLTSLIGCWQGGDGLDVSPEPETSAENPYHETLVFEAIGEVENAETQVLACLRYHQVVTRKRDEKVFHNESGYLTFDRDTRIVQQSLTIPRGLALVAWGSWEEREQGVRITLDQAEIAQSEFLKSSAKTTDFHHVYEVSGDELHYVEAMTIEIYDDVYRHTDENKLRRVDP
ncbi:MAG: DUF1794 domain-containing protein [Pseudomonadales bacterium]|nr:DUF1794 domain-containing protein [Pseudomonadales bacterium]